MPGRNASSGDYRYGFNGYEKDNEVKNITGGHLDFAGYGYDPRLGRRLNVDPQTSVTPWRSPYTYAGDNPIQNIDKDGERDVYYILAIDNKSGKAAMSILDSKAGKLTSQNHYQIHFKSRDGSVRKISVNREIFTKFQNNFQANELLTRQKNRVYEGKDFIQSGTIFTKKDAQVATKENETPGDHIDGQVAIDDVLVAFGAQPDIDIGGMKQFGSIMEGIYEAVQKAMGAVEAYFDDNPSSSIQQKTAEKEKANINIPVPAEAPVVDFTTPVTEKSDTCDFCGGVNEHTGIKKEK